MRATLLLACVLLSISIISCQFNNYTSRPLNYYTFDQPPNLVNTLSNFQWTGSNGGRYGVAYFNGLANYVDLLTFADSNNATVSAVVGGIPMTWEFWAKWAALNDYSRLFDWSSGAGVNNIEVFNSAQTNDLGFHMVYNGAVTGYDVPAGNWAVMQNVWEHVVCSFIQVSASDTTSATAANMSCWVNGVMQVNTAGSTATSSYLPTLTTRTQTWLAQSAYSGNNNFNGWIDSFAFYNYPLPQEAIQAHYLLPRNPILEQTFAYNPQLIAGVTAGGYSWLQSDSNDSPSVMPYHRGLVSFTSSQYINVSTLTGSRSVGTSFNYPFGGNGVATIDPTLSVGISIELVVKLVRPSTASTSRIFSTGNGYQSDEVYILHTFSAAGTGTLTYYAMNSAAGASGPAITILTPVVYGSWLHIVITGSPTSTAGSGSYYIYVNGSLVNSGSATYPRSLTRANTYIGGSDNPSDGTFVGSVDAIRLYDYTLSLSVVQSLYTLVTSGLPAIAPLVAPTSSVYTSGPLVAYTFDNPTSLATYNLSVDSSYAYNSQYNGRTGVAVFNGAVASGQYVDMQTFPDAYGNTFPTFGGAASFEAWVYWNSLGTVASGNYGGGYSRVFEVAGIAGDSDDNMALTNVGTTSTGYFFLWNASFHETKVQVNNLINTGVWQHHIITLQPLLAASVTSGSSSQINWYVNGQLISSTLGDSANYVRRPSTFIGKSVYDNNDYFNGAVDSFYFYNYVLPMESVTVHYVLPKAPVYELTFATNPAIFPSPNYGWSANDTSDSLSLQTTHSGLLTLSPGSQTQYANLATTSGAYSVGTPLPVIGGIPTGNGLNNGTQLGWSFEITFKDLYNVDGWAKIFDLGNGAAVDNILFGYNNGNNYMTAQIFNSVASPSGGSSTIDVIDQVIPGVWYHVVLTFVPLLSAPNYCTAYAYVNGVMVHQYAYSYYPRSVPRTNAYMGKSNWADPYYFGLIDSFRIYDYSLSSAQVLQLYQVTMNAVGIPQPLYQSGPLVAYTFDSQATTTATSALGSTAQWSAGSGAHTGVATFSSSSSQFINMSLFPDSYGNTLAANAITNAVTLEVWISMTSVAGSQRIIELSNGPTSDALYIGVSSGSLSWAVYSGSSTQPLATSNSYITANTYYHLLVTVTPQLSSCLAIIYVNGVNILSTYGYCPQSISRSNEWIGRSSSASDSYLNANVDSVYVYNYALSPEAIAAHYVSLRPPVFELEFSVNPMIALNLNTSASVAGYQWLQTDPADVGTNYAGAHQGMLWLGNTGTVNQQYAYLGAAFNNSHNLGVVLPQNIGGPGAYPTSPSLAGWSIEIVCKINSDETWAKIFDIANSDQSDNILLGWSGSSNMLNLQVFNSINSQTGGSTTMTVINNVNLGQWNHILITMTPVPSTNAAVCIQCGNLTSYVNGSMTSTVIGYYPQNIARVSSYLGKSNWAGDSFFDAKIDAFRIYDYTLPQSQITALAALYTPFALVSSSSTGAGPKSSSAVSSSPSSSASSSLSSSVLATSSVHSASVSSSTASVHASSSVLLGHSSSASYSSSSAGAAIVSGGGGGLSSGAIAGIVVGAICIACCIVIVLSMLLCLGTMKKKAASNEVEPKATHAYEDFADGQTSAGQTETSQVEMHSYKDENETAQTEAETTEAETV